MDRVSNPFAVEGSNSSSALTIRQRLIAVSVGLIVLVCAALTMAAFLFGVLVAVHGTSMPTPIAPEILWTGPLKHWMQAGLVLDVIISVMLCVYVTFRILRMQRLLTEAASRRSALAQQLMELQALQPERNRP